MRVAPNNHHLLHAMRFLTGLNDSFNVVRSQIPLLDLLPSMTKIFSMVLQFERQGCPLNLDDSKALVNASAGKSHGSFSGRSGSSSSNLKRYCTYCHKNTHFVENCFNKHGVPPHMMKNYHNSATSVAAKGGEFVNL
jgi:hypothetical protein